MIPELNNYQDLLSKLQYEIKRLNESSHIYDLLNCLLTLNSLPEWILSSDTASDELKNIASDKIKIMKGANGFQLNENLLFDNIDHQLRFVRLICNHAKHKTNSKQIPIIQSLPGTTLPMMLPARFCIIISIGQLNVDGEFLVYQLSEFWKKQIVR